MTLLETWGLRGLALARAAYGYLGREEAICKLISSMELVDAGGNFLDTVLVIRYAVFRMIACQIRSSISKRCHLRQGKADGRRPYDKS